MADYIPTSYQQQLSAVEDGSLILVIGADGKTVPAIKGTCQGKITITVLTDTIQRQTGESINGPVIYFVDDEQCLVLGKDFTIDYGPMTVGFRPDGQWDLGLLAVDGDGRMFIHAHSREGGQTFVAVDNGGSPNRGPVAVFPNWSVSIARVDGTKQELYSRGG